MFWNVLIRLFLENIFNKYHEFTIHALFITRKYTT